jgi:hypothetical protein
VVRLAGSPSFLRQLREKVHFGLPLKLAEDRRLTGDGTPAAAGEAPDGPPRP